MHKPEFFIENETKFPGILRYKQITQSRLENQTLVLINTKKKTCHLVDFAISVGHKAKIKESKKIHKYLDMCNNFTHYYIIPNTSYLILIIHEQLYGLKQLFLFNNNNNNNNDDDDDDSTGIWFQYSYPILIIFKWIYLSYRWDSNRYYHSVSERTWE